MPCPQTALPYVPHESTIERFLHGLRFTSGHAATVSMGELFYKLEEDRWLARGDQPIPELMTVRDAEGRRVSKNDPRRIAVAHPSVRAGGGMPTLGELDAREKEAHVVVKGRDRRAGRLLTGLQRLQEQLLELLDLARDVDGVRVGRLRGDCVRHVTPMPRRGSGADYTGARSRRRSTGTRALYRQSAARTKKQAAKGGR